MSTLQTFLRDSVRAHHLSDEESTDGEASTFTGVAPGGWFGEGTLRKKENWRYERIALKAKE